MSFELSLWKWTFSMHFGRTEELVEEELEDLLGDDLEILVVPSISLN